MSTLVGRDVRMSLRLLLALFICFVIVAPQIQGLRFFRNICPVRHLTRKHYVTATGTVKCKVDDKYQPLPFVKVELLDDELVGNTKMADGRTDDDGRFALTGSGRDIFGGKPDPKIKVVYDYSGKYGSMLIKDWLGLTRYYRTGKRSYSRNINFDIERNDEHCRAYYRFYHCGLKDYYETVQSIPPYGTLYVTTSAVIAGLFQTAYAPYTKIKLSQSVDPISCNITKHEFAHTIRHYYDGDREHFLEDAILFLYPRFHDCPDETNAGFAFNEGWAEYWADECYDCEGSNYNIEGNVASALRNLTTTCDTNKAQMVEVLKSNPESIHSFDDFNNKHYLMYDCKL